MSLAERRTDPTRASRTTLARTPLARTTLVRTTLARTTLSWAAAALAFAAAASAQSFHTRAPNDYSRTADDNVVTRLNERLARGEAELAVEQGSARGRLRALLRELDVPPSSQTLVFSKTSLQRHRISLANPRALYFNADVYVGWIPGAASLEVIAGDAELGLAFYSLPQDPDLPPVLKRDDSCLRCHAASRTHDEPGLVLRSVFPDAAGDPIASAGEADMDFRSPIAERWGGWLVTGQFDGKHRGNGHAIRIENDTWTVTARRAPDLHTFREHFDPGLYLRPTSDIGPLLALEQQAAVHNLLVRATHQMRYLLEKDRVLNDMLEQPDEHPDEEAMRASTRRIADDLAKQITRALLLDGEAPLAPHHIRSNPEFARAFASMWPADEHGVQLGVFDLTRQTFALKMSPMIHSRAFARLPAALRALVLTRLQVAIERGVPPGDVHMDRETRGKLAEHLRNTLPDWPERRRRRQQ